MSGDTGNDSSEGGKIFLCGGLKDNWDDPDEDQSGTGQLKTGIDTVSYTHLTLPTKRIV